MAPMPSGAVKRQRAPGTSRGSVRAKEAAELTRISTAQGAIPPLSASALPVRPNRRQRAAANQATENEKKSTASILDCSTARNFSDLPLSTRTRDGLAAARFSELTDVQRRAIPQALAARDVLAAAPTGSGKTLAFVVPVLEALWRAKWSTYDGLGALVLAPTRELALQIFEVFRNVAKFHMLSAGLVIGGKDFEFEKTKVGGMNVLVATPGRLLHHMDHVAEFDCSGLRVLVLDEADRILDMGFSRTLDAILENLPSEGRQTLLFSATQTKSVKALARLSLRSPQYVTVCAAPEHAPGGDKGEDEKGRGGRKGKNVDSDDNDNASDVDADGVGSDVKIVGTPKGLSQSYTIVEPQDKLSVLWSFIKTHSKSKVIVFFATGKQVRFAFNAFCKLRPGISLLHIHGTMKQLKRTDMYDSFCRTQSAVLFATDVASRGLDFPDVEWVVQVDCPDDVSSYIHRVGRTARFRANGRSMLFLNRGREEVFLKRLETRRLRLNRTRINPERITSITPRVAALVASSQELKSIAQRAFMFYLKSVYRQHDKEVFNAVEIDHAALAASLGLASAPTVKFKTDRTAGATGGVSDQAKRVPDRDGKTIFGYRPRPENEPSEGEKKASRVKGKVQTDKEEEDEDVLMVKKVHTYDPSAEFGDDESLVLDSGIKRKRKRIKLDLLKSGPSVNRIVFSEDGRAMRASEAVHAEDAAGEGCESEAGGDSGADINDYAAVVSKRLAQTQEADKAREHERVRAKHAKRREKERGPRNQAQDPGSGDVVLASDDDSSSGGSELREALARIAGKGSGENDVREEDWDAGSSEHDDLAESPDFKAEEAAALLILENRRRQN